MVEEEKNQQNSVPYYDEQTGNLVLQLMESYSDEPDYDSKRREYINSSLDRLLGEDNENRDPKEAADKLKELLERKGQAFKHTSEYYAIIKDEQERMKEYRGLEVSSTVPSGENAEIAKNPFKFLNLPEDATIGQTRAAWIRLRRSWFYDDMNPQNKDQLKRVFEGIDFPIESQDYSSWLKKINSTKKPETLETADLEALSSEEQKSYQLEQEAYNKIESEYERVKSEMITIATQKSQIVNIAHAEALKTFSNSEKETFAGFEWEKGKKTSESIDCFLNSQGISSDRSLEYDKLNLEGNGQIRKYTCERSEDNFSNLAFDYGELYNYDDDYRQELSLRSFFAWTELSQDKELCPTLLDDMVGKYDLNESQTERMRLMMMNRESPDFIIDALGIAPDSGFDMCWFIEEVYDGPVFVHDFINRETIPFKLGVEFTPEDELVLKFKSQYSPQSLSSKDESVKFSKADVQIMRAIAYGPLLTQSNKE